MAALSVGVGRPKRPPIEKRKSRGSRGGDTEARRRAVRGKGAGRRTSAARSPGERVRRRVTGRPRLAGQPRREEAPQGAGPGQRTTGASGLLTCSVSLSFSVGRGVRALDMAPVSRGRGPRSSRKGEKGRRGARPGGASHSRRTRRMGPGRGCGEAGQPLTPARGCAARARPRRLRAAPDRTPPTPGWAVPPFGRAELLRLLSAAAAGRLPRSSPALSGTAPRPAHRQPPPDLLLPTWPPPPPALGSFRRQEPETPEAPRNGSGDAPSLGCRPE